MAVEDFDLVIVGAGSGNTIPDDRFDDWTVAVIERADFGGTCMNRGCIPSKMFVYAADVADTVKQAGTYGVHASFEGADWPDIRDRIFGRIDPIAPAGEEYRSGLPNTTVHKGEAAFVDGTVLEVDGHRVRGRHTVLGVGSRPFVPPWPGLEGLEVHTSDTIMRIADLPEHLVIMGGGVIGSEMGHVFEALGSRVTIVTRGSGLLSGADEEVHERFTEVSRRRFDIHTGARGISFESTGQGFVVDATSREDPDLRVEGDCLLVATGRIPNSDTIAADVAGVAVDDAGRVVIDRHLRTSVEGVWAFGDVSAHMPLKHLANAEAKVIAHNLLHPDDPREIDYGHYPRATFGSPQVASVGMTEQQLKTESIPFVTGIREYGGTAYGWAMEDTTSFAKVLASPSTGKVLGAHVMGPHASTLIQPIVQAMATGLTARALAESVIYIHPAMSEVVENALLELPL